ncbi:MAG: MBL fold metallo-hydrolase [Acidobacteriota bacterium]
MAIRENFKEGPVEGIRVGRFGRGINTTAVLYRIGATLVDCGPPNQWRHVKRFLGERPVLTVLLTHHHEDHAGNASRLQARGAEILAPEKALAPLKDGFAMLAYRRIIWGRPKRVQAGALPGKAELEDGSHLIPIPAPGHSPDLTCFHSPRAAEAGQPGVAAAGGQGPGRAGSGRPRNHAPAAGRGGLHVPSHPRAVLQAQPHPGLP